MCKKTGDHGRAAGVLGGGLGKVPGDEHVFGSLARGGKRVLKKGKGKRQQFGVVGGKGGDSNSGRLLATAG